jgi:CHAT domain-containing protein/tetratricopeptide (TPR) repeat protein
MSRFMLFVACILVGVLFGVPVWADDPSKQLTPRERQALQAQCAEQFKLGIELYEAGKLDRAAEAFEKVVNGTRRLLMNQDHHNLAVALGFLAKICEEQGKFADAEPLFREALEINLRLHPQQAHPNVAISLSSLGNVLRRRGKLAEAEPLNRAALEMRRELFPNQDRPELARSLSNLASLLQARGKLTESEPLCREALEMDRRLHAKQDHPELVIGMNNLAYILEARGRLKEAEQLFREVLEMDRRLHSKKDNLDVAMSLNNLAYVLKSQEKYVDAERLARESLEMYQRLFPSQDRAELAASLINLGSIYRDMGKHAIAEPLFREAFEMYKRLYSKRDHPYLAASLVNLGSVLRAQKKFHEAEPFFRQALDMNRRLYLDDDHPELIGSLLNFATALRDRGKYSDAEPVYLEALKMYRSLTKAYAEVRSEGDALTLASIYRPALDAYLLFEVKLKANPAIVYPQVWATKSALSRIYEQRSFNARAASSDPKVAPLLNNLSDARRRRSELLLTPKPSDPTTRKERDDDLTRYAKTIDDLDMRLHRLLPPVNRADRLNNATSADLQRVLPDDSAVIDFLRYSFTDQDLKQPEAKGRKQTDSYIAFVLTSGKVSWIDLGPAEPIEGAINEWRDAIKLGKAIPPEIPAKLRDLLWVKVRKDLPESVKVLYISPDSALCKLPWAALPGDKPGTILLDDFAVATIPHAQFLLDKLWTREPLQNPPSNALVVGGVLYDAEPPVSSGGNARVSRGDPLVKPDAKPGWGFLKGTEGELSGVSSAAERKKISIIRMEGDKATAPAILAALPKAKYAHFATHGFFADASFRSIFQLDEKDFLKAEWGERIGRAANSPLVMTGLVFAGANNPKTPGRGILTGESLIDLDLSGLELAVLSACETGLGDVAGGEGTFGLQRAFHMAGTRDVVASLWKVPDQSTAALMALFYRNLWEKDLSPMESLRQAQLEIYRNPAKIAELAKGFRGPFKEVPGKGEVEIKPGKDSTAHPLLWAAFTLSGPGR